MKPPNVLAGNTRLPCQAQGSESQDPTPTPPGEEGTSWLTLSSEAAVSLSQMDGGFWEFHSLAGAQILPEVFPRPADREMRGPAFQFLTHGSTSLQP